MYYNAQLGIYVSHALNTFAKKNLKRERERGSEYKVNLSADWGWLIDSNAGFDGSNADNINGGMTIYYTQKRL